jgi:Ca2+-binding EF-hand superfamily protein
MILARAISVSVAIAAAGLSHQAAARDADAGSSQLSRSDCDAAWKKASSNGSPLSEEMAKRYVTNFDKANKDADGVLSKSEFNDACRDGLVRQASESSMQPTAADGRNERHTPQTLHAPTNRVGKNVPTMRSDENNSMQDESRTVHPGQNQ